MKKITTIFLALAVVFTGLRAQDDCGLIVEMKGTGMQEEESAFLEKTLTFDDLSSIEYIVVEAIYKSDIVPDGTINFTSPVESVDVSPMALDYYTKPELDSYNPTVFREIMQPAESITLNNTINNPDGIWSFAAYVYRKTEENMMSMTGGEHAYYYVNGMENPAIQYISIPAADAPRDIVIHMGITELNNDTRVGYFTFTAGTYEDIVELNTYDPELGISYTIEEVTLPDIPGDVTEIVVTGFSPDVWVEENNMYNGDSYIGGRLVLTLPCTPPEEPEEPKLLCTYTQGFYGNAGGKTCWGQTTTELLMELLAEDLVIGGGENKLTIHSGHVECLYKRLPGGGPSAPLNGHATCDDPVGITLHKKGTFKNTLLNQTITAALNFRLSPDLYDVALDHSIMIADIENCKDSEPKMVHGSEHEFHMPSSVVDYLGEDATLGMVLDLANLALSGEDVSPLSLSEIGDAVSKINEGFDECKGLVYCKNDDENECKEECEKENNDEGDKDDDMDDDDGDDDGDEDMDEDMDEDNDKDGNCDCDCDCEDEGDDEGEYEGDDDMDDEGDDAEEDETDQEGMQGSSESNVASQVYPNPVIATGIVELKANNSDNAHVAIYDLNGKELFVLYDNNLNPDQIYRLRLPVNELKRGLYILKIITSKSMQTKVFSVAK